MRPAFSSATISGMVASVMARHLDRASTRVARDSHICVTPRRARRQRRRIAAPASRRTRNHAAYSAGRNTSVSTVATTRPPIIATAIGPKKSLRVERDHREHRRRGGQHDRPEAAHRRADDRVPRRRRRRAMSWSIWSTRITELRMMIPDSAIVPSIATKPNGLPNASSAERHADQPERRGQHDHRRAREAPAAGSSAASARRATSSGTPAAIDFWPRAESSIAPPISIR